MSAAITNPATAPRIRVERCVADIVRDTVVYAPGWLAFVSDVGEWCWHAEWDEAMACAIDQAQARARRLVGRW